jgi:AcrR family transcriptional regulator
MAQTRTPLTRERVLEAAIRLADEGGIESLSMRKLARELGVEAMSLYNHVANKSDLMDGMVDLVLGEIEEPTSTAWDVAMREYAISANDVLLRHRWSCNLVISRASEPRFQYMEWLLRTLREAGFSPELAYHAYHALDSHIMGFTLWQLGHMAAEKSLAGGRDPGELVADFVREIRPRYPYLAEHGDQHLAAPPGEGGREYAFALDLILDGLRRALAPSGPSA